MDNNNNNYYHLLNSNMWYTTKKNNIISNFARKLINYTLSLDSTRITPFGHSTYSLLTPRRGLRNI